MENSSKPLRLDTIEKAIDDLKNGKPVIVADDPDRENEVDFIVAAQNISTETVALLIRHGSGVICAAASGSICDKLNLPPMREVNEDHKQTAYAISCDARKGITTGISAADRAQTLSVLANPDSQADDISRPGHVFPLRAVAGGIFQRHGHTEAGVDLMRLAGLPHVAAIVEIMHDDGTMVRLHEAPEFIRKHQLPDFSIITIADLEAYRQLRGDPNPLPELLKTIDRVGPAKLPTSNGMFEAYAWRYNEYEHVALVMGEVTARDNVTVRVHSECLTGDALHSLKCDCGPQLQLAMQQIAREGRGVIVYLDGQEGRGIGIFNKIAAYALQDEGMDTFAANLALGLPEDSRDYTAAAYILKDLGIKSINLLTNNPAKQGSIGNFLHISRTTPLVTPRNSYNDAYLTAKAERGHTALKKKSGSTATSRTT